MTKRYVWLLPLLTLTLTACQSSSVIEYSDDEPLTLALAQDSIRIMQVTDLHLTYGFDANDQRTYSLIEKLAEATDPDIIVVTGDLTMSPLAPSLYRQMTRRIDTIGIPWTFTFGNHDSDFNDYKKNLDAITAAEPTNLLFKIGPEITDGGYGNFVIDAKFGNTTIHRLYMMDSKAENGGLNDYDWLSEAQVAWYGQKAEQDAIDGIYSTVYMHIPLIEYEEYVYYELLDGQMGEDKVYSQGQNTGFFAEMVAHGVSMGVFAGHDHLSNFSFMKAGVMLAYGQTSGYNGYGQIARGARIIEIVPGGSPSGVLTSYLITDAEVGA